MKGFATLSSRFVNCRVVQMFQPACRELGRGWYVDAQHWRPQNDRFSMLTSCSLGTRAVSYWHTDEHHVAKLLAVKRTVVTVSKWPN
ncbi:MAG: hypothetical protein ACXVB4_13645 [Pseudobdellovibrionaceae bacterium]